MGGDCTTLLEHPASEASDRDFLERVKTPSPPPPPPRATCSQLQVLQAFSWEGCKEEEGRRERGKAGQASTQLQAEGGLSLVHKYHPSLSLSQEQFHLDFTVAK